MLDSYYLVREREEKVVGDDGANVCWYSSDLVILSGFKFYDPLGS